MISYSKHSINQQDIDAVVNVLEREFLTQGEQVPKFEKALCDYTGATFCTAVNSATSGLHVACLALGVGSEDIVWTSTNSFAASANCARYCQAQVDFLDIDPVTRNISISSLVDKIEKAKQQNKLPRAIVVVHFSGASCDMEIIHQLCRVNNISIIEDAAHALGATYKDSKVGGCKYSDMTVLSFHPVKSMTTAEGGAVTTNDPSLAQKVALYAKHGITRDPKLMQSESDGPWFYQQLCLGYNYRMSDLQAALGISQLSRLDSFIERRRYLASRYFTLLKNLPLKLPKIDDLPTSCWHLYMVELTHHNRSEIYRKLHQRNIGVNVHYIPIHFHPYYQQLGFKKGQFPNAEEFYHNALTLPIYVDLTDEQQDYVVHILTELLTDHG